MKSLKLKKVFTNEKFNIKQFGDNFHVLIIAIAIFFLLISLASTFAQNEKESGPLSGDIMSGVSELADAFGSEIQLMVNADKGGEIISNISKDKKFSSLIAKVEVHLIGDRIDLQCDKLIFEGEEKTVTAISDNGKIVKLKFQDIQATAGQFKYFVETKRAELTMNPKVSQGAGTTMEAPLIIIQQDEEGNVSVIAKHSTSETIKPSPNSQGKIVVVYKPTKTTEKKDKNKTKHEDKETSAAKEITPDNIQNIPEKKSSPKKQGQFIEKP